MRQNTVRNLKVLGLLALALLIALWWLWIPRAQQPPYQFVRAWGSLGNQPGEFHDPTGIAVTADRVYVSDARNGRIQAFDHQGRFLFQFGHRGDAATTLTRPMNLAIHNDELYVADYWQDRIQIYGLDGEHHRSLGQAGDKAGQFNSPGGVAVTPVGDVIVADFHNHRIQWLDRHGDAMSVLGQTGESGSAPGQFSYPTDVALDRQGRLIVADGYNDRIQTFDADGNFVHKWGGPWARNIHGPFPGWFATVTSVAVGPQDTIFVADFYNHRVQKFSAQGEFLTTFGEHGTGQGQFRHVSAVAVGPTGRVFATDFANHRVQLFSPTR